MKIYPILLLLTLSSGVPQKGDPVSVHVREVNRTEDQPTEKGTWYHIKAVVESKTIVYTLTCDEFLNMEIKDYTLRCYDLAAGKDYTGYRSQNLLNFWAAADRDKNKKYRLSVFAIVSEKEK